MSSSPELQGEIDQFDTLVNDLKTFVEFIREKEGGSLPLILFGNSMGGLETLLYLMKNPDVKSIAGIVNGPALKVKTLDITSKDLTRDHEKQKENDTDPLVHASASNQLIEGMFTNGEWAVNHPELLKHQLLLIQGVNDPVVDADVAKSFVDNVVSKGNPNVKLFNTDGVHETFNDTDRDQVFQACTKFVEEDILKK